MTDGERMGATAARTDRQGTPLQTVSAHGDSAPSWHTRSSAIFRRRASEATGLVGDSIG